MMRLFVVLVVALNLVAADAFLKELAAGLLKNGPIVVIDGFFALHYVENRGCAWGMFQNQVWPLAVFGLLALAVIVWQRRRIFAAGLMGAVTECLLYAGIIGNLIDRVYRGVPRGWGWFEGYVIDFLDFHWGVHHFPCFNLADICICTAAGLMILQGFIEARKGK